MKILLVSNSTSSLYNFRKGLALHLNMKNNLLLYAISDKHYNQVDFCKSFIIKSSLNSVVNYLAFCINYIYLFFKFRPDLIISFTILPNTILLFLNIFFRKNIIINFTGLGRAFFKNKLLDLLLEYLFKFLFMLQPKYYVFFQNVESQKWFINRNIIKLSHTSVLPGSGISANDFLCADYKTTKVTKFLFVGRHIREKGIDLFCQLGDYFSNQSRLSFSSVGPCNSVQLKKLNTSSINYLGYSKDILNVISSFDCVILPSNYNEGVPMSLIQAAALGKIIITTNTPGCSEVVDCGKNGFLMTSHSFDELLSCVHKVLSLSPLDINSFMQYSRNLAVRKFSDCHIFPKYDALIDQFDQSKI